MPDKEILSPEEQYIIGYNEGYLLGKHQPELSADIIKSPNNTSDRMLGFKDGVDQYIMEKDKNLHKPLLKGYDDMIKDHDTKDKTIDKDGKDYIKE